MIALRVVLSLAGLAIAGCSGQQEVSDAAPLQSISAAAVADAVPRADPILAAGNKSPYTVNGVSYSILDDARHYREEGVASWYGTKFHGRKTSNGEVYDLYRATAAHKTLPIPSYVRVTNLENQRQVIVRVNDRGPFHADRIIDLSYAAAVKLGYMEHGTARVRVEMLDIAGVDDRRDNPEGVYRYVQLGAFGSRESAQRLQRDLQDRLAPPVMVSPVQSGEQVLYRVRVGPVENEAQLLAVREQLRASGHGPGQPMP